MLYRVHERLHVFGIVMHHIVSDAWSSGILIGELAALYAGESLPELAVQYADYAVWQHERLASADTHRELALLSAALADAPDLIELPTDRPRPAIQQFRGAVLPFQLDGERADGLRAIARSSGTSTFMVVLAAYALLLSRYSNQQDLVIGSPIANRRSSMTEPLIGFFANMLALRVDLSGNPSFGELLARVKRVALDGYSRQEIPFEQVVDSLALERNLSRTPVFQVVFAYEKRRPRRWASRSRGHAGGGRDPHREVRPHAPCAGCRRRPRGWNTTSTCSTPPRSIAWRHTSARSSMP